MEIKNCPFCGSPAKIHEEEHIYRPYSDRVKTKYYTVHCPDRDCFCALHFNRDDEADHLYSSKEEAINAWNKRAKQ